MQEDLPVFTQNWQKKVSEYQRCIHDSRDSNEVQVHITYLSFIKEIHLLIDTILGFTETQTKHLTMLSPVSERRAIVTFIKNYAKVNALVLPGRIPGYKRFDVQLLPCNTTKKSVWKLYKEAMESSSDRAVSYTCFCRAWQTIVPFHCHCKTTLRPLLDMSEACCSHTTVYQYFLNTKIKSNNN